MWLEPLLHTRTGCQALALPDLVVVVVVALAWLCPDQEHSCMRTLTRLPIHTLLSRPTCVVWCIRRLMAGFQLPAWCQCMHRWHLAWLAHQAQCLLTSPSQQQSRCNSITSTYTNINTTTNISTRLSTTPSACKRMPAQA